ncbi:MAG: hypothetical protein ACK5PP_20015, partial [Acidimicrobiales bacterium]
SGGIAELLRDGPTGAGPDDRRPSPLDSPRRPQAAPAAAPKPQIPGSAGPGARRPDPPAPPSPPPPR